MRLIILVTEFEKKVARHTTIRLAREATLRGHEVWFTEPGGFSLDSTNRLSVLARRVGRNHYKSSVVYLKELLEEPTVERVSLEESDLLLLRDNPAKHRRDRPWAQAAGISFGRLAQECGALVLNEPNGLSLACNKIYLQGFPPEVRPRTLITRNLDEVREFARTLQQDLILKPVQGSGGDRVFLVKQGGSYNLNQLVESLSADGYVVAQEYLPAAEDGDVRMILLNGKPLKVKGQYAAFRRRNKSGDIRSNMHAGGVIEGVQVDEKMLRLAELVEAKLTHDGMFLVGLDIVGDKLMEINVFCPGGLEGMEKLNGVNFSGKVISALEQRLDLHLGRVRNLQEVQH